MKKLTFALVVLMTIAFTSCNVSNLDGLVKTPKFVSVEKLNTLKMGSTFEQTVVALGSQPYDLLSKQIDGYEIYLYKYKKVERRIDGEIVDNRGSEVTGIEQYNSEISNAYLMFKDNKLQMVITDMGKGQSGYLIVLNNKIYKVTTDPNSEIVFEEVKEEPKEEVSFFKKGDKKKK